MRRLFLSQNLEDQKRPDPSQYNAPSTVTPALEKEPESKNEEYDDDYNVAEEIKAVNAHYEATRNNNASWEEKMNKVC
jgi:hypothetical protein